MAEPVFTPDFVLNPPPQKPDGARCAAHPENAATGSCTRCGTFICGFDRKLIANKPYCVPCSERPDVNYLEAFRLKYWGKRDSWAWLYGIGAVANVAISIPLLMEREIFWGLYVLLGAVVGGAYWAGLRWARYASLAMPLLLFAIGVLLGAPERGMIGIIPFIMAMGVFFDTRNRLFFKVEVTEKALERSWNLYANNQMARNGLLLGVSSLVMLVPAPFGLVCSIIGLKRVDPDAHPPIGKRFHAIFGLIFSSIGMIELAAAAVSFFRMYAARS